MKAPNSSEYLSKEILEEDFIKVFSMYFSIQKCIGMNRVDARDRFVTAPSIPQKIYTIIYCIFIICLCCIAVNIYTHALNVRLYYLATSEGLLMLCTFLGNAIHVRFLNKDDNVAFYIKMQEIDRIMAISHCKPINTKLYKMHLFTILFLAGLVILILIMTLFTRKALIYGYIIIVLSYGNFMLEMAYGCNLTAYFHLRVQFINTIMENHIHAQPIKIYTTPNSNIKVLASQSHSFITSDTDVYLESIFECFLKYQDLYRFQVNLIYIICTYI